jgi:dihydrofolate reductase
MRKLVLLMHVSLDGFVAGEKGEMDWINVDDELFDLVGGFTEEADAALYGRKTFQMMEQYWPTAGEQPNATKHAREHSAWYKRVEKFVASGSMNAGIFSNTTFIPDDLPAEIRRVKETPGKKILMIGSPSTVHALLPHGLIDEYRLFLNPVILGSGIPLFTNVGHRSMLNLVRTTPFASGVIGLHYTLKI